MTFFYLADDALPLKNIPDVSNSPNVSDRFVVKVTFLRSTSTPSQVLAQASVLKNGCWTMVDVKTFPDVGRLIATVENNALVYRDASKGHKQDLVQILSLSTLEERLAEAPISCDESPEAHNASSSNIE